MLKRLQISIEKKKKFKCPEGVFQPDTAITRFWLAKIGHIKIYDRVNFTANEEAS